MVSKRQPQDLSDSEEGSSPAKRPRRDDSDASERDSTPEPTPKKRKSKGKGKARDDDDDGEEDNRQVRFQEVMDEDEQADMELEERIRQEKLDIIRAEHAATANKRGRPGVLGTVTKIELTNFMCHKRLTFKFGDQINFIIGHNGSGKSAILTALTVALGAKASFTGRGTGIRQFIKEGEQVAEVEVTLKNGGPEAFKPDEYGPTITVVRRFTKDSSSYKIKSAQGKVISTKREELSAMCEQMQLQVDNPLNVLSQDNARQFLSTSHPKEKYSLFLRGTGLSQLLDEYEHTKENIMKANRTIQQKKEILPELRDKEKIAKAKVNEAQKAEGQRQRLQDVKGELAWAHVEVKQKEVQLKAKSVSKAKRDLHTIERNLTESQEKVTAAEAKVKELDTSGEQDDELQRLAAERKKLQAQVTANKHEITEAKNDMSNMNKSLREIEQVMEGMQAKIDEETAKTADDRHSKHAAIIERMKEKDRLVKEKEDRPKEVMRQRDDSGRASEAAARAAQHAQTETERLRNDILGSEQQIRAAETNSRNELARFGPNAPAVLRAIDSTSWTGRKPVGPLGRFVRLSDPQWAPVLRNRLGRLMFGYVCENGNDRRKLQRILYENRSGDATIFVTPYELFDYSEGEPGPEYLTVLRALQISDPWTERVLINSNKIEKIILEKSRKDGQATLQRLVNNDTNFDTAVAWTADIYAVNQTRDGGKNTVALETMHRSDLRHHTFAGGDVNTEIQEWKDAKSKAEAEAKDASRALQQAQSQIKSCRDQVKRANDEENKLRHEINLLKSQRSELDEELEMDAPVNITALQHAKDEQEEQKRSLLQQFAPVVERERAASERNKELVPQVDELRQRIVAIEKQKTNLAELLDVAVGDRLQAQKNLTHWEKKQDTEKEKLTTLETDQSNLEKEFEEWTQTASANFEPVEKPRTVAFLTKELEQIKSQLEAAEKVRGYTLSEARIELHQAAEVAKKAINEIYGMERYVKKMKNSLETRQTQWQDFRGHVVVRTKELFQLLLGTRGYSGNLEVNHKKQEMNLKVRTDDQAGTAGKDKDPRALSGGEKSFSTICLLLALWTSLYCPIRCLDEFDVFMDSVNRRVSMNQMIKEARAADGKQHILITPLDIPFLNSDTAVKIQKLHDPERGQGTL